MNLEVVWCVLILIALCFFGAVGSAVWLGAFDEYAVIYRARLKGGPQVA